MNQLDNMSNEIKKYDEIVEKYNFSRYIATNKSRFWTNQLPSDLLFQTWEQFVCKRMANQVFGISWPEMEDWGPKDCRQFYHERLMEGGSLATTYHLNLNDGPIENLLSGSSIGPEARNALKHRWDNGFSFKNYQKRTYFALEKMMEGLGGHAADVLRNIQEAEKVLEAVMGEIDDVISTTVMSSRVKHLMEHMQSKLSLADFLTEEDDS